MIAEPMRKAAAPSALAPGEGLRRRGATHPRAQWMTQALWIGLLVAITPLLSGCPQDPMGPDNRMALIAFGRCDYAQALQLTDMAIERGDDMHIQRAWMLKAAILRDQGDTAAAEAIYPKLEATWKAAKKTDLKTSRRERDIAILIDIAHNDRRANGLAADCQP